MARADGIETIHSLVYVNVICDNNNNDVPSFTGSIANGFCIENILISAIVVVVVVVVVVHTYTPI